MGVKIGDSIPDLNVMVKDEEGIDAVSLRAFTSGRKVVIFIVPGAFTPTCSAKHVPSFLEHHDALTQAGIEAVACIAVNDAHVMKLWGEDQQADGKITMMADAKGEVAEAFGVRVDMGPIMGVRAGRSAFVLDDSIFSHVFIEAPSAYEVSSAEHILSELQKA